MNLRWIEYGSWLYNDGPATKGSGAGAGATSQRSILACLIPQCSYTRHSHSPACTDAIEIAKASMYEVRATITPNGKVDAMMDVMGIRSETVRSSRMIVYCEDPTQAVESSRSGAAG
jgi:hypothetical protein